MNLALQYKSPSSVKEAYEIQKILRERIELRPLPRPPESFLALDVSYRENLAYAACVLYRDGKVVETAVAATEIEFPYVPGLLAFREIPALISALDKINGTADVILVDGQGLAHPRRFGLACHVGLLTGLPTAGIAKSHLFGEALSIPRKAGTYDWLVHKQNVVGAIVRTNTRTKPLFVSAGHRILLSECIKICFELACGSRLPEPLQIADRLSKTPRR